MGIISISVMGKLGISPDFPRFWKFPLTGGRAGPDFLQVCEYSRTLITSSFEKYDGKLNFIEM